MRLSTARRQWRTAALVAAFCLSLLVVACGGNSKAGDGSGATPSAAAGGAGSSGAGANGGAPRSPTPAVRSPEQAAHDWVEAAFAEDGETLSVLTCDAKKSALKAGKVAVTVFILGSEALIPVDKPRITAHELAYGTTATQGDRAEIQVTGTVKVAEVLLSRTQKVKKMMHMQRLGGVWKWCGF